MLTVTEWYLICQQIFLMEELFRLVRDENDIDKALSMIRSGYMLEPSYKDQYNCSLLFHAVYRKSLELVKTLVEKGFDVNDRLPDGATPLMSAAKTMSSTLQNTCWRMGRSWMRVTRKVGLP